MRQLEQDKPSSDETVLNERQRKGQGQNPRISGGVISDDSFQRLKAQQQEVRRCCPPWNVSDTSEGHGHVSLHVQ